MKCNLRHHSEQRFCCAGCGRAFSSMVAFDAHRTTEPGSDGRICLNPGDILDKQGNHRFQPRAIKGRVGEVAIWGTAGSTPRFWESA